MPRSLIAEWWEEVAWRRVWANTWPGLSSGFQVLSFLQLPTFCYSSAHINFLEHALSAIVWLQMYEDEQLCQPNLCTVVTQWCARPGRKRLEHPDSRFCLDSIIYFVLGADKTWPSWGAPHMMWSGKQVAWPSMRKCSEKLSPLFYRAYKWNSAS